MSNEDERYNDLLNSLVEMRDEVLSRKFGNHPKGCDCMTCWVNKQAEKHEKAYEEVEKKRKKDERRRWPWSKRKFSSRKRKRSRSRTRSRVMKRAQSIRKRKHISMSKALKESWSLERRR